MFKQEPHAGQTEVRFKGSSNDRAGYKVMVDVTQSNVAQLAVPRFCTAEQLAAEFGFSVHWIYKMNKRGKGPPRLPSVRPYRYDTHSRTFKKWLEGLGVDLKPFDTDQS